MTFVKECRDTAAVSPANDNHKINTRTNSEQFHEGQCPEIKTIEIGQPASRDFRESSDGYAQVLHQFNDDWRVIECRNGIHWILQRSKKTRRGGVAGTVAPKKN